MTITSDTGPFSIVPEWLLDAPVSDRAVRLYALLGRYADDSGLCWPSRSTLADRLGCSTDSVDRAKDELVAVDALEQQARSRPDGSRTSNAYVIHRSAPVRLGLGGIAEGGMGEAAAPMNENQLNENHGSGRKRATAPPDDYSPTDAQCELAIRHGIDITSEIDGWVTWCRANGRTYKDVTAGFSTWLRREVKSRESRYVGTIKVPFEVPHRFPVLPPSAHDVCEVCEMSTLACECGRNDG